MQLTKQQKQARKMTVNGLNSIYKNSRDIVKEWDKKGENVPLNTLKIMCEKAKLTSFEEETPALLKFAKEYNALIDNIYTVVKTRAEEMGSTTVNLAYLKKCVEKCKEGLKLW